MLFMQVIQIVEFELHATNLAQCISGYLAIIVIYLVE